MDNVTIQRNAFLFCRYSVALMVWSALLFRSVWVLVAVFVILALSALLTVRRAPMVWLYTRTLGRFVRSADVVLDVRAMRTAHTLGALLALISISLVARESAFAWYFVGVFGVLKTLSAVGFCPAYKLYGCVMGGSGCCAFAARR